MLIVVRLHPVLQGRATDNEFYVQLGKSGAIGQPKGNYPPHTHTHTLTHIESFTTEENNKEQKVFVFVLHFKTRID